MSFRLFAIPFILTVNAACVKAVQPGMAPDDIATYVTDDGWVGAVRHFPGDGPPVVLVHGMSANHYNWDYHPEVSPIDELVDAGFDVWVPELRGDPGSIAPSKRAHKEFDFDHHAKQDVPAAIDAVLDATGEDSVYWLGHSMGGMLLYTAMSDYPDKIDAGVAVCSPGQFHEPVRKAKIIKGMGWAVRGRGRFNSGGSAKLVSWWGKGNPFYGQVANPKNLDYRYAKGLSKNALTGLPYPMAYQATTWLDSGELTRRDGTPWLDFDSEVPLMVMGATRDRIVSDEDARGTCDRFANCTYVELSEEAGFSADYGHVDPVLGKNAPAEVYPVFIDWLVEQRDSGDGAASASEVQ